MWSRKWCESTQHSGCGFIAVGKSGTQIKLGLSSVVLAFFFLTAVSGCANKVLQIDKTTEDSLKNEEFENAVQIVIPEEAPAPPSLEPAKPQAVSKPQTVAKPIVRPSAPAKNSTKSGPPKVEKRQPDIESDLGFAGRRPVKDPFRVGEKVIHAVTYLKMHAGNMKLEVGPFAQVNGKKAYNFKTSITTTPFFSRFYSVDDYVNVLVDFETLIPHLFRLHVRESAQVKEAQMLFDLDKNTAKYWEKKITEKRGTQEKKLEWDILPFSQNVFSTAFYMRNFQWATGQENSFRVADDGKNLVFKGKAIRREVLETELGPIPAIVLKPEIILDGKFKPTGDIFIWLSDDDRKFVLRIEASIKIGTLVSAVTEIQKGAE